MEEELPVNHQEPENIIPDRTKSQIAINSANIINNADSELFPTIVNQISFSTGIGLQTLSLIISVRSFFQAVTTPIWGWWNDKHSRVKILAIGCLLWGICTIMVGASSNWIGMLVFRALTGIGLAVIVPTTNSLISDFFPPAKRGKAFGWLGLTGTIGALIGVVYATSLVGWVNTIWGISTWRFIFYSFGIGSIGIALFVFLVAKDPPRGSMDSVNPVDVNGKPIAQPILYEMKVADFGKILTNKTFICIVLQGIAGTIPWNGVLLLITWLEYVGFDPFTSGIMFIVVAFGAAGGNVFGGWLGDKAAKWSPNKGRILVAQISVFAGIPMMVIMFFIIPMSVNSMWLYILFGAITGFMITWTTYSTNNPIYAEIFEPEIRGSVYSVDSMLESSLAAFGPTIVTWIAMMFGFQNPPQNVDITSLPALWRQTNMIALAQGIFYTALIPWIICLLFYFLVYFTYPKDRDACRKRMEERRRQSA